MSDYSYLAKKYGEVLPVGWDVTQLHGEPDILEALRKAKLEATLLDFFHSRWYVNARYTVKNDRLIPVLEGGKQVTINERSQMDEELLDRIRVLHNHVEVLHELFMQPRLNEPFTVLGLPYTATRQQVVAANEVKAAWLYENAWYWDNEVGELHAAGKHATEACNDGWMMIYHIELEEVLLKKAYQQLAQHFARIEAGKFAAEVDGRNGSPKRWYQFWR